MRDPQGVVGEVIDWLGSGDARVAVERVRPEHRHFDTPASTSIEPECAELFDELYDTLDRRLPLAPSFVERLNATNQRLLPRIKQDLEQVRAAATDT
jgi:hypothetical protein